MLLASISYQHATIEQREYYTNGYPRQIFDRRFYLNLRLLAKEAAHNKRTLYARLAISWLYYQAVKAGGWASYPP